MATHPTCNLVDISATIGSIKSGINNMKVSISLPDELVRYIDQRVENRSRLVEVLLQAWRKQQEQQAMVEACLLLDELSDELTDEDEAWQQAAITDWEASGL
ncbi:MAG: ribbon-helix-helix domain-containing protein [Tychonema bourrellyi B0820]|nr:ribbon-helix-helix domain-containing protein [Tychonema bourrellyi]MDQ2099201.1 ribbon-helix-helix domain-containing protein [Tychonema bourrellyi B0820]